MINSLQQMNQTLSRAVERAEERAIQLQKKLEKSKEAAKILKYADSLVCKVLNFPLIFSEMQEMYQIGHF